MDNFHFYDSVRYTDCRTTVAPVLHGNCRSQEINNAMKHEMKQYEKHSCDYCHGNTPDDSRGACCACGAPRASITSEWMNGAPAIVTKEFARQHLLNITQSKVIEQKILAEKYPELVPNHKGTDHALLYGEEISLRESQAYQMTGNIPERIKRKLGMK